MAYLDIFHPYGLFPSLRGTETDLAEDILRYKGIVLDSIVEDRLLAEARSGTQEQKQVEQLDLDKRQLDQLYLQPAQKLSAETNQRINALEGEVEKIEGELAQHVTGLGQARRALGVHLDQVQATIPDDGALIEYLRYRNYIGEEKWVWTYGAIVLFSKGAMSNTSLADATCCASLGHHRQKKSFCLLILILTSLQHQYWQMWTTVPTIQPQFRLVAAKEVYRGLELRELGRYAERKRCTRQ